MLTVGELRDRLIADGIAEVEQVYDHDDPRRAGAIEGFELCRSLSSRPEFERVLRARMRREQRMHRRDPNGDQIDEYWRHRYATLQVEWVLNCLLVAAWARPGDILSGRAALKIGEVVGSG